MLGMAALFLVAAFFFPLYTGDEKLWMWLREAFSILQRLIVAVSPDELLLFLPRITMVAACAVTILVCPWITQILSRFPKLLWCTRFIITGTGGFLLYLIDTHQLIGNDWRTIIIGLFVTIWVVYALRRWKALSWGLALGYCVLVAGYFLIVMDGINWDWDSGAWLLASAVVLELIALLVLPTEGMRDVYDYTPK
jgi:hypothetical protein